MFQPLFFCTFDFICFSQIAQILPMIENKKSVESTESAREIEKF